MKRPAAAQMLFALSLVATAASGRAVAQSVDQRRGPLPPGSTIGARDGDTVIIDDDARVRVIRRRHARVRAVYNVAERWVILLARYQPRNGITTDAVDAFTFREVEGDWPLGDKWEGDSTIEVYSLAGQAGGNAGIAFRTPQGLVQLFGRDQRQFSDPTAASVLGYRDSSRSTTPTRSFDEIERLKIEEAAGARPAPVSAGVTTGVTAAMSGAPVRLPSAGFPPAGGARKIHDVRPVWPDEARRAGVQGIVIVEFTVSAAGDVVDARILRGIPLLDQAALECVRQWRYQPTLLNGQPIPVRMSAAVIFP